MMNMGGTFTLRPEAEEDLKSIAAYVGRSHAAKTVDFLRAAKTTIEVLADSPFLGSIQSFEAPRHHSLRRFRVSGYPSYLIWYRPFASKNGIEVWRVLHSSQDVLPRIEEVSDD